LFVQAIIALIGLAVATGNGSFSRVVVRSLKAAVPGPGGTLLTHAVTQAHQAGISHRYAGLIFGLVGSLITGSTLVGQLERGHNRIYGIEAGPPDIAEVRPGTRAHCRRGHARGRGVRVSRVRRVDRRLDPQRRREDRFWESSVGRLR
jgi:hypothetical protein